MNSSLLVLKNKRILFAEDDLITRTQIASTLKLLFKTVYCACNGEEAFNIYEDEQPDMILTDIRMPQKDGIKLTRQIRERDYTTPIIILTSFDDRNSLLNAANLAIDGYLLKPIEFNALVQVLCKSLYRIRNTPSLITFHKNLVFNCDTKEFYRDNHLTTLGKKELELIELLLTYRHKTLSKEFIEARLWNYDVSCHSSVKNLVLRIRKKLGDTIIASVKGVGYRINIDDRPLKEHTGAGDYPLPSFIG